MAPDGKEKPESKDAVKPEAVQAVPGTKLAEVPAAKAGEVKAKTGEATKAAGEDVAKPTVAPAEAPKPGTEEIPDNKWSRYYYDLKDQVDKNPALQGPLTNMMLALLLMAAKYDYYADLMPGRFVARLEADEDLKDKKFDKEKDKDKIEKIVAGQGTEAAALESLKKLQEENQKAGKKTGMEKACTRYVTNVLWGVDGIDDAASLSAYLLHTKKSTAEGDVGLYNSGKFNEVKNQENIAKGTILIFIPDLKKGNKTVAYATGNKDEFKYFDIEKDGGQAVTFNLRSADSPVKSEMGVMAVLVPNTVAYAAATDVPPEKPAEPVKPTAETEAGKKALQEAADKAVADIEKGNQETRLLIDEYKSNPNPPNLPVLLQVAGEKEKAAQQAYDSVKSNFEGIDKKLTDARAAEASAKVKSEAAEATEADKKAYEEAQKKTAEIQKVKDYQSKFETILNTAKANADDARKLANPEQK